MADNVTVNGVVVKTDEIPGQGHAQQVKLLNGTPDSAAPIVGTTADGLYVDVRKVRENVNVVGPLTDAQLRATPIGILSNAAAAATVASVAPSTLAQTLKVANTARRGLLVENDSSQKLRVQYGAGASLILFTVSLAPGSYWEMPSPMFTGLVSVIWDAAATGRAVVTEVTA